MNNSTFDVEGFLDSAVETPFDTARTTLPAGDDYLGQIHKIDGRIVETKNQGDRRIIDVTWKIINKEDVIAQLNLTEAYVRQTVWLDFDVTGTKLARGVNQNIQLGQIREAVGQNHTGAWSPRQLVGAGPARLKISERVDEKNPALKFNDVDRVTRMS